MNKITSVLMLSACMVALSITSFSVYAKDPVVIAANKADINVTDLKTLQKVPGIGKRKAKTIIEYRQQHGPFTSMADLHKIRGLSPRIIEHLKQLFKVTVHN